MLGNDLSFWRVKRHSIYCECSMHNNNYFFSGSYAALHRMGKRGEGLSFFFTLEDRSCKQVDILSEEKNAIR